MSVFTIVALCLATMGALLLGVGYLASERARRRELIDAYDLSPRSSAVERTSAWLERHLLATRGGQRWRERLDQADVPGRVGSVALGAILVSGLTLLLAWSVGGPILAVIVMLLLLGGSRFYLRVRMEKRRIRFVDQLPELSRLLANATNAGLSMPAALAIAAQETTEPMRSELARVNEELALGTSLDDVLARMSERLPSKELAVLLNVLIIQTRAGGRIVTALRGITEALESRRDVRREVGTLLAGSKATVVAVGALGALMVFLVHTQVDGGLRGLLENPIGLVVFVVSSALFVFGLWLISRFTKVEI